jgi:hypothetical protein
VGSALVVLASPPLVDALPAPLRSALQGAAAPFFNLVATLPSGSLASRLFYGSFAPLPALFGSAALTVHAALLGLPWAGLSLGLGRWSRRVST